MTNEATSTHTPSTTSSSPDLSEAINQSVERLPGEYVRSVRVFGHWYRCNWWTGAGNDWLASATGRISRSRFLHVVKKGESLDFKPPTRMLAASV